MRASVAVVLALCVAAAIGGAVLGTGSAVGQSDDGLSEPENATQTIEIQLDENGDANVSVYKQLPLEDEEDREAFDRLATEFEDGEASEDLSIAVFERLATEAENETDREMAITDAERETEATNSTGTLRLQFTWEGFARVDDGRLEVGDVFVIDGETWLPSLSDDQRLMIHAPEGYAVENAETTVDDGTLVWEGPESFESADLEATLVPSERADEGFSVLTIGLGLGLVGAIAVLTLVLSRRLDGAPIVPAASGDDRGWAALLAPATDRTDETRTPPPEPEADPGEPDPDPFAGVDEDLLSDEERVLKLLEANDGRMKQATIVTETDWSNAKVSQLLSAMEDAGEIEKLRIGRENLITLREEE